MNRTNPAFPSRARSGPFLVLGLSGLSLLAQTASAPGNPTGGQVTSGSATITAAGATLNINQGSNRAIINWQTFSINSGETTKFLVPSSSSATLNRVLGGNPSAIYGTLQSNGQLFLINPNGIVVGAGGRIDTAGFLASTLDVPDSDFLSGGALHFSGTSTGSIDNEGVIQASGGDVYLIAGHVTNGGAIHAPQGNVGLAAGTDVLFQPVGDQHLFIQPASSGTTGGTGITNKGAVASATAELRAAGGNAYALAINNTGSIAATGFRKVNGQVYLTSEGGDIANSGTVSAQNPDGNGGTVVLNGYGAASTGTVLSSGKLVAAGTAAGSHGGTVQVLGNQVGVTGQGAVDVSGPAGGGTALVGGGAHGADPAVPDASQTYVGPDATITADALTLGNGGTIVLWGSSTTQAYGALSARGGAAGGNGGYVETSALTLDVRTVPDVSAPNGLPGTWLLDPSDITITDDPTATSSGFDGTPPPPFTVSGDGATLSQADLLAGLQGGNVELDATAGYGEGGETITWQHAENGTTFDISSLTNNPTLTLIAPGGLTISGITIEAVSGGGSLNLNLNNSETEGDVQILNSSIHLNGGSLTAYGSGFQSTEESTNIGQQDGIYISGSTLDMGGGTLTLNGYGGFYFNNAPSYDAVSGGVGVAVVNGSTLETTGVGTISITGEGGVSTDDTYVDYMTGIQVDASSITTTNTGLITLGGTVSQGVAQAVANPNNASQFQGGAAIGVSITDGSTVSTAAVDQSVPLTNVVGTGLITITGNTTGSLATQANLGVYLAGGSSFNGSNSEGSTTTRITSGNGAGISITGTADQVNNSVASPNVQTPETTGLLIDNGVRITANGSAPITLMGTGGSDNNSDSSLTSEHSRGLEIGANGSGGNGGTANDVISSASGAISLTGVGGSSPGGVDGIQIDSQNGGSSSITSSAGSITLNGSLPNQTATQALGSDGDAGVTMSGDPSSNALSSITAEAGSIDILGTISSGTSNSKQAGVVLSSGTAIQAEGTGGSGFDAQGDVSIVGNTTGSTALSLDVGVLIEETKIAASGVTSDILGNSGLTIQGTASEIDGASGTTLGSNAGFSLAPLTAGVGIVSGATLEATGAATMTITGTGGENSSINPESSSFGIVMFSTAAKAPVSLTTGSGVLALTGTAGTSPFTQDGILIGGPLNVGSVTINAGGDFSAIATSNADIFIAADISAATTTLSDPGQEVDFFNMGPSSFGPLNLSAATAVVYQQPSIDLNFAFVSGDLTLLTAGNIEQSGPLVSYVDPALLSAAAGGSITLNGFGNFFASLGQINASGSVSISSQGAPLTPGSLNSSTIFPLEIQGLPYVIDLNLVNLLPTLGLTIQPIIGTSASAPTSLGGGSILGQELAIVLPVENQVAPGDVDIVPVIVVVDSSDLGGDISYNRHGGTSRIYQAVSTLGGASSGDAEVGPNDVVQLHGGTVNTSHLPPGLAHALQNALNTQVRQDLSTALGGP